MPATFPATCFLTRDFCFSQHQLMAFKIYTKTGDAGHTGLIGGTKVPKNDLRIETYGTVDELNSWMGMVNDQFNHPELKAEIKEIQDRLFTIGSLLATDHSKQTKMALPDLHESDVQLLESRIDIMTDQLPEMKSFILPGGHPTVSSIHVARCVCRRAERLAVSLQMHDVPVEALVIQYLNRLSDYLFTLARYAGMVLGAEEIPWKARV
ncbi:cob(I)alamin adenosyltransferase [Cnuella takakiae]|uniref:Corrinoid adenosyltransferase n=2 Tax=Cnuella takakiae TaxID=1302690 RepID=A0A1M5FN23_9BACT|nr:cob(I)alamin adenosyltransferase [Cnuella takakiae]